jgi:hypothetical protein
MMDHENAQSIFRDGTKNKMKVASILIQQSVLDRKQQACREHAARSPGNHKNDTEVGKKSVGAGRWVT